MKCSQSRTAAPPPQPAAPGGATLRRPSPGDGASGGCLVSGPWDGRPGPVLWLPALNLCSETLSKQGNILNVLFCKEADNRPGEERVRVATGQRDTNTHLAQEARLSLLLPRAKQTTEVPLTQCVALAGQPGPHCRGAPAHLLCVSRLTGAYPAVLPAAPSPEVSVSTVSVRVTWTALEGLTHSTSPNRVLNCRSKLNVCMMSRVVPLGKIRM